MVGIFLRLSSIVVVQNSTKHSWGRASPIIKTNSGKANGCNNSLPTNDNTHSLGEIGKDLRKKRKRLFVVINYSVRMCKCS